MNKFIMYLFLLILPILDLFTSLLTYNYELFITPGVIFKSLFLIYGTYYILFRSKSKYKKLSLYYILFIFIYIIIYFISKIELLEIKYLANEINYLIKFIYLPFIFMIFLNILDDKKINTYLINKIMRITVVLYSVIIVIPTLFNFNISSYSNSNYAGSVGLFYSANEISSILLLLLPFIFKGKNLYLNTIIYIIYLISLGFIGTKVTLLGLFIILIIILIYSLIKNGYKSKFNIYYIILIILSGVYLYNNNSMYNMNKNIEQSLSEIENSNNDNVDSEIIEVIDDNKLLLLGFLSDRDVYLINTYNIYQNNNEIDNLLFGLGFSNTNKINDYNITKLIEMDFFDILFHLGLLGLFIILLPFIYLLYVLLKRKKLYLSSSFILLIIGLILSVSFLSGHVLMAPAVSIYLALYMVLFADIYNKVKINNNKISILGLHMNYGGVERAIACSASMLIDKYDVDVISLYNDNNKNAFKYHKKVNIIYLMNTISNRNELLNSIKNKNIIKIIKESIKSIYILIFRYIYLSDYIINSDSKIIISTRYNFSNILNEYGNNKCIKIHEEHTYNINNSYINNLYNLNNIDYIKVGSIALYNEYSKLNNKLIYVPLCIDDYPDYKNISKLNNSNIISIGRLEKEKGYKDLIDVISRVKTKVNVNIFGDGSLKDELIEYTNNLNLKNIIKFHGFKDKKYINKYLENSSLYVMTSLEESFGLVILEALSYGIPCILFDSAKGSIEMIKHGENGFIIYDRDIDKMAQTIDEYFSMSKQKKEEFRKCSRKTINKYKFDYIKKIYLKEINKIMEEK